MGNRLELPMQTRMALVSTFNAEARTVEVIWSQGAAVKRYDPWNGRTYMEELDVPSADLASLNGGAPVLNSHDATDLASVIGVVERAWVDGAMGKALIRFDDGEATAPIVNKVKNRIIRHVSVGYNVRKYEITEVDGQLPVYRAVDWEPVEVSLVPIGADAGAGVRAGVKTFPCEFIEHSRSRTMADKVFETTEQELISLRAQAEVRKHVSVARLSSEFADDLISRGLSGKEASYAIIDELAKRSAAHPIRGVVNLDRLGGEQSIEDPEFRTKLFAEALSSRNGGPAPSEEARQFVGMRIVDMARQILEMRGMRTTMLSNDAIIRQAMLTRDAAGAMHTTSDFPALLQQTGNRTLRMAYESYAGGLRNIARPSTSPDFRPKNMLNLSETPALLKVNEHGEFQRGTMAEDKASYSLSTYGRIFSITRQSLINDDVGAFQQLTMKFGRGAVEFESQQIVNLLTSNPPMSDAVALFHANHGNLAAAGAISVTTLGSAKQAMRLQKGLDGVTPIDASPKYLVVPAALETVALQFLTQLTPNQASLVNPFAGMLELVVDPRLDAISATQWYMAADPGVIDTIEYSFLDGQAGPFMETDLGFEFDGFQFKVRLDFGSGVLDWRGLYRNG